MGRVTGDPRRLDLLAEIIGTSAIDDVGSIVLPKDLTVFAGLADAWATIVSQLLAEGRLKVERVERLVCALYDLPEDLTEAVVQHAVERAAR